MMGLYGAIPSKADHFRMFVDGEAVRSAPFAKVAEANAVGVADIRRIGARKACFSAALDRLQFALALFASHSFARRRGAEEFTITERLAQRLNIRGDRRRPVQALSGATSRKSRVRTAAARSVALAFE